MNKNASATRLNEYITALLPWAHGHQLNAISDFVAAIIDKQTGNQAALARVFGNQEAATRRLSRLLHNPRLSPHQLADAVLTYVLAQLLEELGINYIIRVKCSTKVWLAGQWCNLQGVRFQGNSRGRSLGRLWYCQSNPHRLYVTMSRARNEQGQWEVWYLMSNGFARAAQAASEYARRFGCEHGFRDSKWQIGFGQARIREVRAWSR